MTSKVHFNPIVAVLILFSGLFFLSSSGGRDDAFANAPGDSGYCNACHGGGDGGGSVSLSGAPASYTPGQTYPLTLTITDEAAVAGGFQIVATNNTNNTQVGTFSASAGTRINPLSRLVHSAPKGFSGNTVSWTFNWTAPSSGLPSFVKFYFAGNAVDFTGSTSGDFAYAGVSAAFPLPIELLDFQVKKDKGYGIELTWATATEKNLRHFEVQRSEDGGKSYTSIGEQTAAGESQSAKNYTFYDKNYPKRTKTLYYRLRTNDYNGESHISPVAQIDAAQATFSWLSSNVLAAGTAIQLQVENTPVAQIELYGMDGRRVNIQQVNEARSLEFPTIGLSGLYFLRLSDKQNLTISTEKVIIH